jgi:hypothetical protein
MDFKEAIKTYPTYMLTPFIRRSVTPAGVRQLSDEEKQWVCDELHARGEHIKAYPTHYLSSLFNPSIGQVDLTGAEEQTVIEELRNRGYFDKN